MSNLNVFAKASRPKPTKVYDTFWRFAAERQEIFFRRLEGIPAPWTTDPILAEYKFTNAYRASDRTSQFLIRNVLYRGNQCPEEIFFRCILFKVFNRQSTWDILESSLHEIRFSDYSFAAYDKILEEVKRHGQRIFSAAYIMPTRSSCFSERVKHRNYLVLLNKMITDTLPQRLAESKSMGAGFKLLRSYPLIGDFLAYQFITDLNYSTLTDFSENEFVMPGPGARDGIRKCFESFGDFSETDIIRFVTENQEQEFTRLGLTFRSLWGRRLQLIDCQNLFCEVDKYSRLAHPEVRGITGRTRIKQRFTENSQAISYLFPSKWGLSGLPEARSVNITHRTSCASTIQSV